MTAVNDTTTVLAQRLARLFADHEEELYVVGGAVRDELLGKADLDLDFATSAPPGETYRMLEEFGAKPYRVGEKFGTIAAVMGGLLVEITTYRSETYEPGSRKPAVVFGTSLREDLERRDFTVNAMARHPVTGELIDPLGGLADLRAGVIRAVGNPYERFAEDPLRLLRAVRLAAQLAFDIEPATWEAMSAEAGRLRTISRERIRDEYSRMLTGPHPVRAMELLRASGLMAASVPELLELSRMPDHGPRHPLSLWDHAMRVLETVLPDLALRWAALLHDIAKPATRTHEPGGRPRFFGHEGEGAEVARRVLSGLHYSNEFVDAVAVLVETHMQAHGYSPQWSDGAVRRLALRLGDNLDRAIELAQADATGHGPVGTRPPMRYDALRERVEALKREVPQPESPLDGNELMERYNRPPGPWIRRTKDALRDAVIDGHLAPEDRAEAWKMADELMRGGTT